MDEKQFKPFHGTYRWITFIMSAGMIYPNPRTDKWRLAAIPLGFSTVTPLLIVISCDVYKSLLERDMINIIRHSTVIGPFLLGIFKMILMYYKRREAQELIDEIDRDYEILNHASQNSKDIASVSIKNCLTYNERGWIATVLSCVSTYPGMAIGLNLYNYAYKSEPKRYMIHDLNKPFSEPEERFESPYYELMFAYMFYVSILYIITFAGYDGFFGLTINHACLKMDLFCKSMDEAMRGDVDRMQERIVGVVKEQLRMFRYVNLIQDTFSIWLCVILMGTSIQICSCMYHIMEGYGLDFHYIMFVFASVLYIYLPCRYATKIKTMGLETATRFYCSGWEEVPDQSIKRMVLFMIARAQLPIEISVLDMVVFDMDLFVSILQTSYSLFTLFKS